MQKIGKVINYGLEMSEEFICKIRQVIFDAIEDENELTQEHRIWLLNTLESLAITMYIRKSIEARSNENELSEVTCVNFANIIDYVFENYIK